MKRILTIVAMSLATLLVSESAQAQLGGMIQRAKSAADNMGSGKKDKDKGKSESEKPQNNTPQSSNNVDPDNVASFGSNIVYVKNTTYDADAALLRQLIDDDMLDDVVVFDINKYESVLENPAQYADYQKLVSERESYCKEQGEIANNFAKYTANMLERAQKATDNSKIQDYISRGVNKYNIFTCGSMIGKASYDELKKCYNDYNAFIGAHKDIKFMAFNVDPDGKPLSTNGRLVYRCDPIPSNDPFYSSHPLYVCNWTLQYAGEMRTDDRCSFNKRSGRDYGYVMSDGSIYTTRRCTTAPTYVCTLGNNGQIYNKAGQQIGQIDSKGVIYKGAKGAMKAVGEVSSHRCYKNGVVAGFMDDGTGYTSDTDGLFRLRFTVSEPHGEFHFAIMMFLYSLFI